MATEGSPPPFCGPIWLRVNRIFPLAAAPAWAVVAGIAIPRAVIAATATAAAVFTRTSRLLDWVPDALLPGRSRTETAGKGRRLDLRHLCPDAPDPAGAPDLPEGVVRPKSVHGRDHWVGSGGRDCGSGPGGQGAAETLPTSPHTRGVGLVRKGVVSAPGEDLDLAGCRRDGSGVSHDHAAKRAPS